MWILEKEKGRRGRRESWQWLKEEGKTRHCLFSSVINVSAATDVLVGSLEREKLELELVKD